MQNIFALVHEGGSKSYPDKELPLLIVIYDYYTISTEQIGIVSCISDDPRLLWSARRRHFRFIIVVPTTIIP